MKILRSLGNEEAIVDSASRLVVMYRLGSMGAPAAAEMKTKDGTLWEDASCARVIARKRTSQYHTLSDVTKTFLPESRFMSS